MFSSAHGYKTLASARQKLQRVVLAARGSSATLPIVRRATDGRFCILFVAKQGTHDLNLGVSLLHAGYKIYVTDVTNYHRELLAGTFAPVDL